MDTHQYDHRWRVLAATHGTTTDPLGRIGRTSKGWGIRRAGCSAACSIGMCLVVLVCVTVGCARTDRSKIAASQDAEQPGTIIVDEVVGGARLLVSCVGCPPGLVAKKCIKGDGLSINVVGTDPNNLWWDCRSEKDYPITIDYSLADSGRLSVTYSTYDPRRPRDENVPFIVERIRVQGGRIVEDVETIVLEPDADDDAQRLTDLVQRAERTERDEESGGEFCACLAHIRNIGIGQPDKALAAMGKLATILAGHCHSEEEISDFTCELERIKAIRNGGNSKKNLPFGQDAP